jgi:energy-coupling factor transporter ATP-binding protein EcfA2
MSHREQCAMGTLLLIHGPNGVGKSTVCRAVHQLLPHSAWLESEWCRMTNPFIWNEDIIALAKHNISQMLRGYLTCHYLDYVIFPYGFHWPRRQIWDTVLSNLADIPYLLAPITLTCGEEEHIARMTHDGRDPARIERALATRYLYDTLPYPKIDTTFKTVSQIAERVIEIVQAEASSEV